MEKTIAIRNTEITFSIWDLGGTSINNYIRTARICKYASIGL